MKSRVLLPALACASLALTGCVGPIDSVADNHEAKEKNQERTTAPKPDGNAAELARLKDLHDRGMIPDAEYYEQRQRILGW